MNENFKYKVIGFILLVAILAGSYFGMQTFHPDFYNHTIKLACAGDVDGLSDYIDSFGYGGFLVSILLLVICNLFGIPTIPFLTVNGSLFGLIPGMICSYIGEVLGVEITFLIGRLFFRQEARKFVEKKHMLAKLDRYSSVKNMAILRGIPYGPNILCTAIAVISPLTRKQHFKATLIGKVPSVAVEVLLGHDLIHFKENGVRFLIVLGIMVAAYLFHLWYKKHHTTIHIKK